MITDRTTAPALYPFAALTMPAQVVEHLANGVVFHRFSGGDQPVCRLTIHIPGGISELGEATVKVFLNQLTEGTKAMSAEEIAEALDYNGARFATQAHTHFCVADFAMLTSRVSETLPVLYSMLTEASFPDDRLDISKLRLKNALRTSLCDPSVVADQSLSPLMWGKDNPLSNSMTEADIDAVDAEMLRKVRQRLVCPSKMHAYLSGLLDTATVDAVRSFLESIPASGEGYDISLHPAKPETPGTMVTKEMPSTLQCAIACGIPTIGRDHPDYVPLRFAVMALGGYFGSRLMSNIREEKGLTYGISSSVLGGLDGAYVYIGTLTDRKFADEVIAELRRELADMSANPPSGEELERFRTYAMTGLVELLDNPTSVMQYYGTQNLVNAPSDYFECQQRVLQNLTSDEIARVSRKYLDPSLLRISLAR